MAYLPRIAPAEEARNTAGHTKPQWERFKNISLEKAKELLKNDPKTWPHVPADVRARLKQEINTALVRELIPEVGDDVIAWRMAGCIRDQLRPDKPGGASIASSNATNTQPAATRPFDPIRDI